MDTPWTRTGSIVTISSPWLTIYGERWLDERGRALDYWRVEKAHSVVVLPVRAGQIILPPPQFRPGVGRATLDLPGGRLPEGASVAAAAAAILERELGLAPADITALAPLNEQGWIVNSSFSSQLLYGVVATLAEDAPLAPERAHRAVPCTPAGVAALLRELECLQCRAVLQDYLLELVAGHGSPRTSEAL